MAPPKMQDPEYLRRLEEATRETWSKYQRDEAVASEYETEMVGATPHTGRRQRYDRAIERLEDIEAAGIPRPLTMRNMAGEEVPVPILEEYLRIADGPHDDDLAKIDPVGAQLADQAIQVENLTDETVKFQVLVPADPVTSTRNATLAVWEVSPGHDGCDLTIFDDEIVAGEFAAAQAHRIWDDQFDHAGNPPDPSPRAPGPAVTIRCREMLRSEFAQLESR